MPRENISGFHDCAKALSAKRGCSVSISHSIIHDVLDVMVEEIERLGGVQFVNIFTIKKYFRHERQGFNPATEEPMFIPARYTLRLNVGKGLFERLNPDYEFPDYDDEHDTEPAPMPIKFVGRFKPGYNAVSRLSQTAKRAFGNLDHENP